MSSVSLSERAYAHLRSRLLSGHLRAGERVSELSLASEIGISKTPVREAIRQLESEGVLRQVPRVGTIVHSPTRREILELYDYRIAVESYAAVIAAQRITPKELDMLRQLCDRIREVGLELRASGEPTLTREMVQRTLTADMAFHMVLLGATGNRRMIKAVEESRVLMQIFCFSRYESYRLRFISGTYLYHMRILKALQRRDAVAAREWTEQHIRISMEEALANYDRRMAEGEEADRFPLTLPPEVKQEIDQMR